MRPAIDGKTPLLYFGVARSGEAIMWSMLRVGAGGKVTFPREVLEHLGIAPGEKVVIHLLPERRLEMSATQTGSIERFVGCLAAPGSSPLSIDEITDISQRGWAGIR